MPVAKTSVCDCLSVWYTLHVDTDDDGGTGVTAIASVVTVITCALLNIFFWLCMAITIILRLHYSYSYYVFSLSIVTYACAIKPIINE